jgi:serine/threonine-protein kinase
MTHHVDMRAWPPLDPRDERRSPGAEGVSVGQVLAGKYRVERVLGIGGMGVVVAAHHIHLDERVALKLLLPETLRHPEGAARFLQEARSAVKIKSEHVTRVTDVAQLEDGSPYIVMEYLEGIDLSTWLTQYGPMPVEQAVDFVLQACEAIAEAHTLGIVHRDIKPANLFCVERPDGTPSIKVLDFGISKYDGHDGAAAAGAGRSNAVLGSPLYMAPEQLEPSKGVDARADIWSLGVTIFELVTGRTPFQAETVAEAVRALGASAAPLASSVRPDVPPALDRAIAKCLEKEQGRRFVSVSDLAVALAESAPEAAKASVERIIRTQRAASLYGSSATAGEERPQRAPAARPWDRTGSTTAQPARTHQPTTLTSCEVGEATPPVSHAPHTLGRWAASPGVRRTGSRPAVWVGIGVSVCLLVVAAVSTFRGTRPVSALASGNTSPPASASVAAAGDDVAAPPASGANVPTIAVSALPEAPVPVRPTSAPRSSPTSNRTTASAAGPSPAATTAATPRLPDCDPPYVVDDKGRKHFKAECFLRK